MKKRLLSVIAAILSVGVMLTACGKAPESKPAAGSDANATSSVAEQAKPQPVKISHHPYIHGLPTAIAERDGIYEKNGLIPEVTLYAGGPAQNEASASNAWQVGTTGMGGAVLGCIGYDMKIIGASAFENSTIDLWVRPDSDIAKVKGEVEGFDGILGNAELWKGKTVICQSATNCHLLLLATLEKMGLTKDDITMVDMNVAQSFPAFKAGEGDVVALWSPFGYQAEAEGWIKVSSAEAVGLQFCNLIIATKKAVEEEPELVQNWLETYLEAADYIKANIDEAPQWLYDYQQDEGINTSFENCVNDVKNRPFPTMEEQKKLMCDGELKELVLNFASFLVQQGNLTQADYDKLASSDFVDSSFVENIK
ncbi:MAG: ABC transporter substrate-binding protein [Angelakisella sp.]